MIKKYQIPKIKTGSKKHPNGVMVPIWKDYDKARIKPRFVYYVTCAPKSSKGPYFHKKRRGLLTLIEGKIIFVYKTHRGFKELYLDSGKNAIMLDLPKKTPYLIGNPFAREARLINICDYPWKRGDGETTVPDFSKYFSKYGRRQ